MGRQPKPRKPESNAVGKGKITPLQVAFLVDQYLSDNNFLHTRSIFRSEASSFLPKTRNQEFPDKVLSLGELLNEYISLKEQKLMVDQAKYHLEQENARVQTLLQGMQGLLNVYNLSAATSCLTPPPPPQTSTASQSMLFSGYNSSFKGPLVSSESIPDRGKRINSAKSSDSIINSHPSRKRKTYMAVPEISQPTKKSCGLTSNNQPTSSDIRTTQPQDHASTPQNTFKHSAFHSSTSNVSPVQGSTVAKKLFNQSSSQSPNSNSSGPKTPNRSVSFHIDKSISPPEEISSISKSNLADTSLEPTPTNCTIISSKKIIVSSPAKNFSVERKLCTYYSPSKANMKTQSKRDHVKGRLDFDTTDLPIISENANLDVCTTSDSDRDVDIFDFDLDTLGPDFSISDLLNDLEMDCGGVSYSCQEATGASTGPLLGSFSQPNEGDFCVSQDLIEQDYTAKDSISSVRSITQSIRILSPAKIQRRQ